MSRTEGPAPLRATPRMPGVAGQGQKKRQEGAGFHAVGLVEAVLHGGAEEVAAALGEGGDQQCGALDVGDGVGAGVGGGEQGAGFLGGKAGGGQRQQQASR